MEQKQQEQNEVQSIHIICDNFGQQKLQLQINDILYVSNELKLDEEYFENFNELEEFIKTNTYNLIISGEKATLTYVIKILRKQINFIFECFSQPIILNDIIDENRLLKKRVKNLEKELDGLKDKVKELDKLRDKVNIIENNISGLIQLQKLEIYRKIKNRPNYVLLGIVITEDGTIKVPIYEYDINFPIEYIEPIVQVRTINYPFEIYDNYWDIMNIRRPYEYNPNTDNSIRPQKYILIK